MKSKIIQYKIIKFWKSIVKVAIVIDISIPITMAVRNQNTFGASNFLPEKLICIYPKTNKEYPFETSISMPSLFHINILLQNLETFQKNKIKSFCGRELKL